MSCVRNSSHRIHKLARVLILHDGCMVLFCSFGNMLRNRVADVSQSLRQFESNAVVVLKAVLEA